MRPALLDVNLLVALFDPDHPHHDVAHDWFGDHHQRGWATCPLTENGLIRVLANPRYGAATSRAAELVSHLAQFCASRHHVFWPDSISLTDRKIFNSTAVGGHRQITDVYLLGLAKKMGGYLATLDRGIPLRAVVGATPDLLAIISEAAE